MLTAQRVLDVQGQCHGVVTWSPRN